MVESSDLTCETSDVGWRQNARQRLGTLHFAVERTPATTVVPRVGPFVDAHYIGQKARPASMAQQR
ncbi:MAG: hypothetical protein EBT73_05510 [Actinobacteria bacterium]|nr:hypothetical protein [Actinomycetota bacterium]